MRLDNISGDPEPVEMLHDAEQAYQKWEVTKIPSGLVGWKLSSDPTTPGRKITPFYVLVWHEHTGGIDFSESGFYGGDYLLKVEIPCLPGIKTKKQFTVTEWGSPSRYFPGNPVVTATEPILKQGCEALIMTPTKVIDIYKWDIHNPLGHHFYKNADGEIIELM